MEFLKSTISIIIIIGSFTFCTHLVYNRDQNSPPSIKQTSEQLKINGISYTDIRYIEIVKEPIQYVIIYTDRSAMTLSKNEYLKIRESLMRYNIIELGGK